MRDRCQAKRVATRQEARRKRGGTTGRQPALGEELRGGLFVWFAGRRASGQIAAQKGRRTGEMG